ncbi:DUF4910 domain-containing protein [Coprothermobacter platensis]|uniref:DUF4910 domain-containing protein n=1 Tax=Coprothermobacter platensis TaxID=108819 RepID=UPI0003708E4B|nr:DUF4910 domain-containing protein [Coprothermobacter platensis]
MDPTRRVWGLLSSMDRLQGTTGLIEAAELIAETAQNLGMNVVTHYYSYDGEETVMGMTMPMGWEVKHGICELKAPQGSEVLSSTEEHLLAVVPYSPAGDVEGVLVCPNEDWSNVNGKIAFTSEEPLVALYKASNEGAIGVLWYQDRDVDVYTYRGLFLLKSHIEELKAIPVMQVKPSIAKRLKKCLRNSELQVHLSVDSLFKVERMPVVEARIDTGSQRNIVLTAHYCHVGPGSDDNASGSAGLIHVAQKLLKNKPTGINVIFLWVPEHYGTVQWLEKDAQMPIEANINLDMIAASQILSGSVINLNHDPWALLHPVDAYLWYYLSRLCENGQNMLKMREEEYGLGSDHAPFTLKGIPGVMPITWPDTYYHSSGDYLDKTDWNVFETITEAVASTIKALDQPQPHIVQGWAQHFYGKQLAENPSGADVLAYFLNKRLSTNIENTWQPTTKPEPFKAVMPMQSRAIETFLRARSFKEKQPALDVLLAQTIILSRFMGMADIEAVLKAESGSFDENVYEDAVKTFLEPENS